jgi:hypothetical protein
VLAFRLIDADRQLAETEDEFAAVGRRRTTVPSGNLVTFLNVAV